jgi:hypothetical protein
VSETPQGPGWWQASDGRYYPPESAPGGSARGVHPGSPSPQAQYPQAQYPQGSYEAPQYPPAQPNQYPPNQYPPNQYPPNQYPPSSPYRPPRRSRGRGCLTTLVIVVVLLAGLVLAGRWALGRFTGWVGSKTDSLVGGAGCPFATDAEVGALVGGGPVKLVKAGSLTSIVSGLVDSRVIPNAPSCWGMSDGSASSAEKTRLMRIASQTGPDAAKLFRDEVAKAKGVTVNKGNGLGVTGESYYNKAVKGIGDEAFCTSASASGPGSAGVVVRKGDRLVYVSLTPDFSKGAPGIGTPGRTMLSTDDESCALAQKIVGVVLTH